MRAGTLLLASTPAALAAVAVALLGTCTGTDRQHDGTAVVTGIVDGDTIDVRIGGRDERVRLTGIDTPETKQPNSPIECYGPEATAFTASLLPPGTTVRIERDVVGRDDYGRLLGYVYAIDDTTGASRFINQEIIRTGHATPLAIEPNTAHAADFSRAARAAEADDLGLWGACSS